MRKATEFISDFRDKYADRALSAGLINQYNYYVKFMSSIAEDDGELYTDDEKMISLINEEAKFLARLALREKK